jgi:hypothetical protein
MATDASLGEDRRPVVSGRGRALELLVVGGSLVANVAGLVVGIRTTGQAGILDLSPVGTLGAFLFALTIGVVGIVLRARRPDHPLGWTFLVFGIVAAISQLAWGVMVAEARPGGDADLGRAVSWLGAVLAVPTWAYLITTLVVQFPSGFASTPRERSLLRWAILPSLAVGLLTAIHPGALPVYPAFDNPIVVAPSLTGLLTVASGVAYVTVLVPGGLAVVSMVGRYREASNVERHQLRWFAFAAALTTITGFLYVVVGVVLAAGETFAREASYALFILTACSLPVAVLIAITRYDLFDIDRIIGRTVAYGALTAILAGLYAASVRSFNALFVLLTGQSNEAALILTTLVLATTFTPIKTRLEHLAATRFPPDPRPGDGAAATGSTEATAGAAGGEALALADLDARMEAIARRVTQEVIRERSEVGPDR